MVKLGQDRNNLWLVKLIGWLDSLDNVNHLHQRRDLLHGLQPRLERLLLLLLLLLLVTAKVVVVVTAAAVAVVDDAEAALIVVAASALGRVLLG